LVNAYERSAKARKICLAHWGTACVVCSISFEKVYGDIGKDFIHVHHLDPLAMIKKRKTIDPKKDLRPVCPNCHAKRGSSCQLSVFLVFNHHL
jgi:5-methylcytosine-specific restriction protein A